MGNLLVATQNVSQELLPIITNYVRYRQTVESVSDAQERLNEVSGRLEEVQRRLQAVRDARDEVEFSFNQAVQPFKDEEEFYENKLDMLQLEADIQDRERKLSQGFGMSDYDRTVLTYELERDRAALARMRAENEWDAARTDARLAVEQVELEENAIQREVRARKEELELAEERRDIAREEYELSRAQLDAIREQNRLMRSNQQQSTSSGGSGGGSSAAINQDQLAQERYNYELADTAGRLEILRNRLAGVQEGTKEWYDIQLQIRRLEEQQASEQQRIADQAAKEEADRIKAEEDYQYSLLNTAGKLDFLKNKLAGVEEGSVEYYRILGQIRQLESQSSGAAGGGGGAGGGAFTQTDEQLAHIEQVRKEVEEQRKKDAEAALAAVRARKEQAEGDRVERERAFEEQARARQQVDEFVSAISVPFVAVGNFIQQTWNRIWDNVKTPVFNALNAINGYVQGQITILVDFWNKHGESITKTAKRAWEDISRIINGVILIIAKVVTDKFTQLTQWMTENQGQIQFVLTYAWLTIKGVIESVLNFIKSFIYTNLSLIRGDWEGAWVGMQGMLFSFWGIIESLVRGALGIILGIFNTDLDTLSKNMYDSFITMSANWQKFVTDIYNKVVDYMGKIVVEVGTQLGNFLTSVSTETANIKKKWDDFVESLKTAINNVIDMLPGDMAKGLRNIISEIEGKVKEFTSAAAKIGQAIIDGIVGKIKEGVSAITNAARSAAREALDRAVDVFTGNSGDPKAMATNISAKSTASPIASVQTINNFEIDARGSTMKEDDFKRIVIDVTNKSAKRAARIG
jgi:hypothetical protein